MGLQPIDPYDDPRVTHEYAILNGRKYHYVQGFPKEGTPKATIFCLHGFPDFWYGWKEIIPYLLEKGLRVVAPDMIGFGKTDMPRVPPEAMAAYSYKSVADDMYELTKHLQVPKAILLGHDWGGFACYRVYLHHPGTFTHIISICSFFTPVIEEFIPLENVVKKMPSFTYQIAFNDPQTEKDLDDPENRIKFLRYLYRSSKEPRPPGKLQVTKNIVAEMGESELTSMFTEKDFQAYLDAFSRGFHGPLNWYKTRKVNFEDERNLELTRVEIPVLFIGALKDGAVVPEVTYGQEKYVTHLTFRQVDSSHWVLTEAPDAVIAYIDEWLDGIVFGSKSKI